MEQETGSAVVAADAAHSGLGRASGPRGLITRRQNEHPGEDGRPSTASSVCWARSLASGPSSPFTDSAEALPLGPWCPCL